MALILIVDDELTLADLLEDILLEAGFAVIKAGDGQKGLGAVATHRPDVVVTDFMMPGKTGLELAEAMRADPALRHIPVILTTGAQGADARCRPDLFQAILEKPYSLQTMLDTVARLSARN